MGIGPGSRRDRQNGAETDVVGEVVPELVDFLGDRDGTLRGQAVLALGEIGDGRAREGLEKLIGDRHRVSLYENEDLSVREIGNAATEALKKLSDDSS